MNSAGRRCRAASVIGIGLRGSAALPWFMGSFNLQDWTRIGAMNPFLQRKPKRQRTGAVQDLAEARKHVALACVLECGMEPHRGHEPGRVS